MASTSLLSEWPPVLNKAQIDELTLLATSYAFSTGLLYLPPGERQPPIPEFTIHAPLALFPSPFPRNLFEQAKRIQGIYNVLYARIALDNDFLDRIMGTENGVGKVDDFIGQLWTGWKALRDKGLAQALHLGLFRSDYLLHSPPNEPPSLKQVEFNTISVSFGSLSQCTARLHRYLLSSTQYYNTSSHLKPDNFPTNETIAGLTDGLAAAHKVYNNDQARILFVVQPGERNVFDQRPLEYELLERHGIHAIRQTFDELAQSATLDSTNRVLRVGVSSDLHPEGSVEISVVYFRAGYAPYEYQTPIHYQTRFLLEQSKAINCPSIALQLAGGKKIQEVLTQPGVLEHFLSDKKWGSAVFSEPELHELRGTFMAMWGLDVGSDLLTPDHDSLTSGKENHGVLKARQLAHSLVLKPQREGGGNNVYKDSIPLFLDQLPPKERQAWIAMELIVPPNGAGNYLVRAGGGNQAVIKVDVVSELGIFGWALFGSDVDTRQEQVGWLVRTKGKDSDEGGVATGFSVLDSVLLPLPMNLDLAIYHIYMKPLMLYDEIASSAAILRYLLHTSVKTDKKGASRFPFDQRLPIRVGGVADSRKSLDEKQLYEKKNVSEEDRVAVSTKVVDTAAEFASGNIELDPSEALRVRKKIDYHILPMMVQYMDKVTLGSSAILGIREATHLSTNQYNWLGTVFYLSYLAFEFPQNLALQRFPVGKWMSLNITIWGITLCCHAACKNFAQLFVARLILGMCEGSITAGFLIVSSMFYTRTEQTLRVGYWFLMNGTAQIIIGFISFGTLHIQSTKFQPWQWLMIITGLITLVVALAFWFFFPDSPTNAWFLTKGERIVAIQRIKVNQTGVENKHFKKDQMIEALCDPKTWLFALFSAFENVPNSLTNQRQIIENSFGFTILQTTLLGCVDGAVEIVTIWAGVNLAARIPNSRAYVACAFFIPNILGVFLVNFLPWDNKIGLLIGVWITGKDGQNANYSSLTFRIILGVGTTGFVLSLSWLSNVTAGHTKRVTVNAIMLCAYCIGNSAGPFMWQERYKPRNHVPWIIIGVCYLAGATCLLMIRYILARENKIRDQEPVDTTYDNVYIEKDVDGVTEKVKVDKEFLDLTDHQNRDFRYVL
ncbi:hypothetical protein H0H93_005128 [Arthromyces matolae]|nr:hypothetical protein H0H93_005128 [Arthromyces matolae]